MQRNYAVSPPFWYSPMHQDPGKPVPEVPQGREAIGRLSPYENATQIMKDVNRELPLIKIGNKSLAELRADDAGLTTKQKKMVLLTDDEISKIKKNRDIKKIREMMPNNIITKDENFESAYKKFKDERFKLLDEKIFFNNQDNNQNLTDFKDFLKKHLLKKIKDPRKQEYLADNIARNLHQSGIGYALPSYSSQRISLVEKAQLFFAKLAKIRVMQVKDRRQMTLSCDSTGKVTFHLVTTFNSIVAETGDVSRSTLIEINMNNKDPIVQAQTDIYLEAKPSPNDIPPFRLSVEFDKIHVKRNLCYFKEGIHTHEHTHVNQFLSKAFSSDPLVDIYLQKHPPKPQEEKDCKPNAIYVYIEDNKLKYYKKTEEGHIIKGEIENTLLSPETIKAFNEIAPDLPATFEEIDKRLIGDDKLSLKDTRQKLKDFKDNIDVLLPAVKTEYNKQLQEHLNALKGIKVKDNKELEKDLKNLRECLKEFNNNFATAEEFTQHLEELDKCLSKLDKHNLKNKNPALAQQIQQIKQFKQNTLLQHLDKIKNFTPEQKQRISRERELDINLRKLYKCLAHLDICLNQNVETAEEFNKHLKELDECLKKLEEPASGNEALADNIKQIKQFKNDVLLAKGDLFYKRDMLKGLAIAVFNIQHKPAPKPSLFSRLFITKKASSTPEKKNPTPTSTPPPPPGLHN